MAATAEAGLWESYQAMRQQTMKIVAPLETEDYVIQTAPFMSPPRWHIGHTSWFFELLLKEFFPGYKVYSEDYLFFFNSYYEQFGARIQRDRRGAKSRPTVRETVRYREHIDAFMLQLLSNTERVSDPARFLKLFLLGCHHEMQHQELLVYDIKHLLCDVYNAPPRPELAKPVSVSGMAEIAGGLFEIGDCDSGFAFDNERPSHKVYAQDFAIDRALVTNGEYLEFMRAGGYEDYRWWFSEGWNAVQREQWQAPMYWERDGQRWMIRDFHGVHPAEERASEPVSHVSFYEASAFSKWAGKRLPSEAEWERAARFDPSSAEMEHFPWGSKQHPDATRANLFDNQSWGVTPIGSFPEGATPSGCHQMIGDVWEWTTSDYVPYPGFKPEFDEYNDKWMVGQKVLRGGSYATPDPHIRSTYRNFFYPHERWMISGFRCAKNL